MNACPSAICSVPSYALAAITVGTAFFLESLEEFGFLVMLVCGLASLLLQTWEANALRFEWKSVPRWMLALGGLVLLTMLIWGNLWVLGFRRGEGASAPPLQLMIVHLAALGIAAAVHGSYYSEGALRSKWIVAVAALLSLLGAVALDPLIFAGIGDTHAQMLPTQRCYPGGGCYSVGLEAWGGFGTLLLSAAQLLQIALTLNALVGAAFLLRRTPR